ITSRARLVYVCTDKGAFGWQIHAKGKLGAWPT
nr:hypothetical protein [Tanacetum cinerariifolium]